MRSHRLALPLFAVTAWSLAEPVVARQQPTQPVATAVTLPATSDLSRLLDLVALRLSAQLDYDPVNPLLKGQQVTLRTPPAGASGGEASGSGMSDQELWATVSRLLVQRGLTTVRGPGSRSLTVVKLEDAGRLARIEPLMTTDAGANGAEGGVGTENDVVAGFRNQPVRLRHVSLKEAGDALRVVQRATVGVVGGSAGAPGGVGGAGGMSGASSGDLLLLSDISPRIDEQLAVLRQVDTAENATVVQGVAVGNVAPVQLAAVVMQLAAKRELVSGEKLPGEVIAAGGGGIGGPGTTAGGGTVAGGGGNGSVMIVAPRRVVERWKQLIALADQRETVVTQTYSPRLFSVKEVAALIQQIAGSVAAAGIGDERFRVITEEPTGSLIVTATPTQHEKIAALMARLDSVPGESRRPVRSFLIRNRQVSEFVETLQRLVSAGVLEGSVELGGPGNGSPSAAPPSGMGQTPPAGATTILPPGVTPMVPTLATQPAATRPLGGVARPTGGAAPLAITLTADESTNTLIAVGDGRVLDQLGVLIKALDVRQAQVMVEAVLVSLAEDDSVALGVELQKVITNGSTSVLLSSLFGIVPPTTGGGPFGGATPPALAGGTALVINPGDYSAVINALQKVSNGRTVSLPKMLVINNKEAVFNSVRQEPYAASFTAGNSSSPTTSFGGTQDAGTQMTVRPQISDGNTLLLDYNISISQFAGSAASANVPPPRQVTSVKSLATIPDGYTVVVGGLEAFSEGHNAEQVPLISQVPLIGELFKNQVNSKTKTKFYVFIHASVMRDASLESLRYASDVDAGSASLPTSWPKSAPQVVR